jgi:heme/copper-type cytochrome/quinol oxidase subunit 2
MAIWEQVLLGMGAVVLVFLFWPGARAAMQKSKEAENPDWQGALYPIVVVVLFIFLLVLIARG